MAHIIYDIIKYTKLQNGTVSYEDYTLANNSNYGIHRWCPKNYKFGHGVSLKFFIKNKQTYVVGWAFNKINQTLIYLDDDHIINDDPNIKLGGHHFLNLTIQELETKLNNLKTFI